MAWIPAASASQRPIIYGDYFFAEALAKLHGKTGFFEHGEQQLPTGSANPHG